MHTPTQIRKYTQIHAHTYANTRKHTRKQTHIHAPHINTRTHTCIHSCKPLPHRYIHTHTHTHTYTHIHIHTHLYILSPHARVCANIEYIIFHCKYQISPYSNRQKRNISIQTHVLTLGVLIDSNLTNTFHLTKQCNNTIYQLK